MKKWIAGSLCFIVGVILIAPPGLLVAQVQIVEQEPPGTPLRPQPVPPQPAPLAGDGVAIMELLQRVVAQQVEEPELAQPAIDLRAQQMLLNDIQDQIEIEIQEGQIFAGEVFFETTASSLLDRELERLSLEYDFTQEEIAAIKEGVKTELEIANQPQNLNAIVNDRLDFRLRSALVRELQPYIPAEDHVRLSGDVAYVAQEQRRIGIESVVWMADQVVSLSEEQHSRLIELVDEIWQDDWTTGSGRILYSEDPRPPVVFQMIELEKLDEILDDNQLVCIMADEMYEVRTYFNSPDDEEQERFVEKFVLDMLVPVNAKIDEIDALCGLSDGQRRRLIVGAKGAALKAGLERFEVGANEAVTGETMRSIWSVRYEVAMQSLMRQKAWQRAIESTLNEEQAVIWSERESLRRSRTRDVMAGSFTSAISVYFPMSKQQYSEFHEMVLREVPESAMQAGRFEVSMHITFMDEEKYREILAPDQFDFLVARFEVSRASYPPPEQDEDEE